MFLSGQRETLYEAGIAYPSAGTVVGDKTHVRHLRFRYAMTNTGPIPSSILADLGIVNASTRAKHRRSLIDEFDAEIDQYRGIHTMVLSDEALFRYATDELAIASREFMMARFDDVEIVIYLRRPDRYLESFYSQHIKAGGRQTLSGFVEQNIDMIDYAARILPWVNQFGPKSVHIISFDRRNLVDGDVVADFASRCGLAGVGAQEKQPNQSLSVLGCHVLRNINLMYRRRKSRRPDHLRAIVSRSFSGAPPHLDSEIFASIVGDIRASHEELLGTVGSSIEGPFYSMSDMLRIPAADRQPDGDELAELGRVIARSVVEAYEHSREASSF